MNRSTFCGIKYINRLFFSKAGYMYMVGVGFKILTGTPVPKLPELPPPHKHRGYTLKRIYKFKEHYMNRSTFCEVKYMNRLFFFQRPGI